MFIAGQRIQRELRAARNKFSLLDNSVYQVCVSLDCEHKGFKYLANALISQILHVREGTLSREETKDPFNVLHQPTHS